MSFKFRNMQLFIRNCIEPHVIALNQMVVSRDNQLKDFIIFEIEELKKLFKKYQDELDKRFDDLQDNVEIVVNSITTIPVGTVVIWPHYNNPSDANKWFDCDGSVFSMTTYPDLYQTLGKNSLPDYRGYFLRGVGGNSASLGVHQSDRIRNMTGRSGGFEMGDGDSWGNGVFAGDGNRSGGSGDGANCGISCVINFDASRVVPTGPENNPINKSVRYLIRSLK